MTDDKGAAIRDGAVILFCALILRGAWFTQPERPLGGDEPAYHALAVHLLRGEGFVTGTGQPTAARTPGLPLFLCALYSVAGPDYTRARIVLVALTSLTALALYRLCLLLFRRRSIALLAGLSWAVLPTSQRLAGSLLGEPLAALCLTVGLLLTVQAEQRRSVLLAAGAGFVLGYAVLTRVYLLLGVMGPLAWLRARSSRRLTAALLLSAMVILGGWSLRNSVRLGTFTLSTQTWNVWLGNNAWTRGSWFADWTPQLEYLRRQHPTFDELGEVGQSRVFIREAIREVTEHPKRILWLLPRKLAILMSPSSWLGFDWLYAVLLPFSLLGVWHVARDAERRRILWLLGVPVVGVAIVGLLTFGDPRFRHPVDPLLTAFAAVGAVRLASALAGRCSPPQPVEAA